MVKWFFSVALVSCFCGAFAAEEALETEFWQRAIDDAAAKGGGLVRVSRGRHRVGQLYLRSGVELHLEEGATLEGAAGLHNYVVHALPYSEGTWSAVVMGLCVTNVAITGRGEIFGNGGAFENVRTQGVCKEGFRPRGVFFSGCKDVRLEDFLLRDAACWGIVFKCCEGCVARRVRIDSNVNLNNDGFDIEARDVIIEDCDVSCGDDAYCIKSNDPDFVVENVMIRRCVARTHCNAFKIGTASHGTMRKVRFENCRSELPNRVYRDLAPMPSEFVFGWPEVKGAPHYLCGPGIGAICVECVDGGTVEDVVYEDVEIGGCQVPIFIRGGDRRRRTCGTMPENIRVLRNVTLSRIRGRAESAIPSSITGVDGCRPKGVVLKDVEIECVGAGGSLGVSCIPGPETAGLYPEATMFRKYNLPVYGLFIDRPEDVRLENVRFTLRPGTSDERPPVEDRSPYALSISSYASSYDVAAYVWPAYQPEPRWRELDIFDAGKGEWQNVWEAVPKWAGHCQPLEPLWGYEDESDPKVVERKIDTALAYGVNVFIYDWYWYCGRPFLQNGIDRGFLGAANNEKMRFYLMWANHHVNWLWDNRVADKKRKEPRWRAWVSPDEFRELTRQWISKYFLRPNYYRIEGKPVLMIYELKTFVEGVGGIDAAARAVDEFRAACVAAGHPGLHLMVCDNNLDVKQVRRLKVDSATIYNFIHWSKLKENVDYATWSAKGAERFDAAAKALGLKGYFAHASAGWDTNPRYPAGTMMPTAVDSTPEKFEVSLRRAKDWCDRHTPAGYPHLVTVNSWNEWTEGSYLEPDRRFGYGYLEAVKRVFGDAKCKQATGGVK